MYTAKIQNAQGQILRLNDQEDKWAVLSIAGLTPAQTQLSMSDIYGMDGARMTNARIATRNIVIMLRLCGDVEVNRLEIYGFFPQKAPVRFYYKTRTRDVYIDGYVEMIDGDLYSQNEILQISMICPDPYFRDVREYEFELENSQGAFEFPFSINIGEPIEFGTYEDYRQTDVVNDTTNEIPFTVEITPTETLGSWSGFDIMNMTTGEKIGVSSWPDALQGFEFGDVITISTDPYHPTFNVRRGGTTYNLIPYMSSGSTFFVLHPGSNVFAYRTLSGDDNKIEITLKFRKIYRGV